MSIKTAPTIETFPVVLDLKVSLEDQIRRGNYGYVDDLYTAENFPLSITGKRDVILYDPKGSVSSKKMIARMKAEGYVPATLDDALAMGAQFPDRQKKNPIVFLGTVWTDPGSHRHVPALDGWGVGPSPRLILCPFDLGCWEGDCRFAAVRGS